MKSATRFSTRWRNDSAPIAPRDGHTVDRKHVDRLGLLSKGQNLAFLIALAYSVAVSANFPPLILSMYWFVVSKLDRSPQAKAEQKSFDEHLVRAHTGF
ncbi:hypothetical protein [Burkholderia cenocepacia]|uniref:hypothetical protein n=1 Tax=Burkholderia cenocepacia TaxID=95486 RepID=UPI002AB7A1BF|nr:hypothetical protein [Burkholderia cenocepacia]